MAEAGEPNIRGFWAWFAAHEAELLEIVKGTGAGKITESLDKALVSNNLTLTYEVTEGSFGGELTFTPQGDPDVAIFLDRFVSQAPSFEHWVIHSRIQKKPITGTLAIVKALYDVDLHGLHLNAVLTDNQYNLEFIHPELFKLPEEQRYAVAGTFLDHALGEAIAMGFVASVGFKSQGGGIEMGLMVNELIRETEELQAAS